MTPCLSLCLPVSAECHRTPPPISVLSCLGEKRVMKAINQITGHVQKESLGSTAQGLDKTRNLRSYLAPVETDYFILKS